ncbi:hypothetical protein C2S53_005312 [Perilla frutescens var. hirtella]|uniref:TRF2/HOY1 PH-like domain-containing protein n=1 Tax=Perilla frutescens var. hirtella TaxID=608512 RepID=A0AAD4PDI5_PERFH|nr:hypothetical protein C2S53_005312 [Perilla frutescens var. hirtella]
MVQLMGSLHSGNLEDFSEEEYGSLPKRSRFEAAPSNQLSSGNHVSNVPPSQYNPLDEPSPLGLRLRKSPSLLDLVQMTLSQRSSGFISGNPTEIADEGSKKDTRGSTALSASDKLKASNFQASLLRIGSWEYVSKYEGDLVAKCYFAKHKLVWEVLEGGLKSKIEIQWSDITALKAELPDNDSGTLTIVLARQPAFFRETNPQPRKHTLWQATTDFTDGQASTNKQHFLQCPPGMLNKHYEKLLQCDMRLSILSQQPEIILDSPYFKSQAAVCKSSEESAGDGGNQQPHAAAKGSPISAFQEVASSAGPQLCASEFVKNTLAVQQVSKEAASPSSGMDTQSIGGNRKSIEHDSAEPKSWESLKVSGPPRSISMTDLVNHIGNCISEQMTSGSLPSAKALECHDMLENISQVLLSDTHCSTALDERSLMKKVNSLCSLLQDPVIPSSARVDGENRNEVADPAKNVYFDLVNDSIYSTHEKTGNIMQAPEVNFEDGKQATGLPRKDSLGDLLLHLPRIASLPKFSNFLYGIAEGDEYQSP